MTKSELLRHMLANVEAGREPLAGMRVDGVLLVRVELPINYMLEQCDRFSIAPRTRVINGFTVPAPMEKEPDNNDEYFCESPTSGSFALRSIWDGDDADRFRFGVGIHTTAEAAAANCKARYGIDPKWGGE